MGLPVHACVHVSNPVHDYLLVLCLWPDDLFGPLQGCATG